MRQLKKTLLALLCVGVLFGMTACGTNDTADQNAVNDATEGNNTDKNNVDKNNVDKNNADSNNTDNDGVLEDVGRGIDNGVRDVVDGVEDVVDGNETNRTDTANHAGSANNGKAGQ